MNTGKFIEIKFKVTTTWTNMELTNGPTFIIFHEKKTLLFLFFLMTEAHCSPYLQSSLCTEHIKVTSHYNSALDGKQMLFSKCHSATLIWRPHHKLGTLADSPLTRSWSTACCITDQNISQSCMCEITQYSIVKLTI